jgi:hypothetical protein
MFLRDTVHRMHFSQRDYNTHIRHCDGGDMEEPVRSVVPVSDASRAFSVLLPNPTRKLQAARQYHARRADCMQSQRFYKGFMLITRPEQLVLDFFRRYGHPIRPNQLDRAREVLSMLAIVLTATVYPSGLVAFVFVPVDVQWVWLGYQLFAMLAMHLYQFINGDHLGSTLNSAARALSHHRKVYLSDESDTWVLAMLKTTVMPNVETAGVEVKRKACEIFDQPRLSEPVGTQKVVVRKPVWRKSYMMPNPNAS